MPATQRQPRRRVASAFCDNAEARLPRYKTPLLRNAAAAYGVTHYGASPRCR